VLAGQECPKSLLKLASEYQSMPAEPQIERFQAKWKPVRVKKTRQIKNPEPRFDSIEAGL
jgi:hypothetical protein